MRMSAENITVKAVLIAADILSRSFEWEPRLLVARVKLVRQYHNRRNTFSVEEASESAGTTQAGGAIR